MSFEYLIILRLALATWLAGANVKTLIIDAKEIPVECGHADGLEARSLEILESFDLVDQIWKIANRTTEICIWVLLPVAKFYCIDTNTERD